MMQKGWVEVYAIQKVWMLKVQFFFYSYSIASFSSFSTDLPSDVRTLSL